ncbi:MAG: M20/M25/M40 family metallo-hydrolase [Chthoniobacterales bacterium]
MSERAVVVAGEQAKAPATTAPRLLRVLLWAIFFGAGAFTLRATRPPAAAGPQAPLDQFSASRAMSHLEEIARKPHPIGSAENRRVRDYLLAKLHALGARATVEETTGIVTRDRYVRAGHAQNIVATFPGIANSRAVLLVAHYDSVPEGPGAADDGAGVISILEAVRALRTGGPLRNDLIVLLTDGEEAGLLGAAGFVADHPDLARHVGVIINLEARGSAGPVMMFETSEKNGALISDFARAAPYPMASSLMYSVYRLLPNDTDVSVFKSTGVAALNFAFAEKFENYHTRLDTKANLDPRSVQQMGANALGLARYFGQQMLGNLRQPDRIYFNWLGQRPLFVYPVWVGWLLAVLSLALCALGWFRAPQPVPFRANLLGIGGFFLLFLAVVGGMFVVWTALEFLIGHSLLRGDTLSNQLLVAGLITVGFICGNLVLVLLSRKLGWQPLALGLSVPALFLAMIVLFILPGASYVFQWPVLFGLASLVIGLRTKSLTTIVIAGLAALVPALLLLVPLIYFFFVGLNLGGTWILAAGALLTWLLAVSSPFFHFAYSPRRGVTVVLGLVATGLFLWGAGLSHTSARHPRADSLLYSVNVDLRKAKWISYDAEPDRWTKSVLGTKPARGSQGAYVLNPERNCLSTNAPALRLPAPTVIVRSDQMKGTLRALRLHLDSPRHARSLLLRISSKSELQSISWNGRVQPVLAGGPGEWFLRYDALPPDGVDLELHLLGQSPVTCWLADSSLGWPSNLTKAGGGGRPADLMQGTGSDLTLVARQIKL